MRILRSLNRRGFNVGSAGYFSVLRQNTWFAASRLSDGFESLIGRSNRGLPTHSTPAPRAALSARATSAPALALIPHQYRPARAAVIVCAAIAITFVLLWWIMHP